MRAAQRQGVLADAAEEKKRNDLTRDFVLPRNGPIKFVPFAMEASGALGESALGFLDNVVSLIVKRDGTPLAGQDKTRRLWWIKDRIVRVLPCAVATLR